MVDSKPIVGNVITRFAERLRFPQLFFIMLALFGLDLLIPDFIPFLDEIMLGLTTVLIGSIKRRREEPRREGPKREHAPGDPGPRVVDAEVVPESQD